MASIMLERSYAPTVPSPLNPTSCRESPRRSPRQGKTTTRSQKSPVPLSPTQRLLRQKAAAAWRSETLHVNEPNADQVARIARTGFDETRQGTLPYRDDESTTMDLENRAGLPTRGSTLGEKGEVYVDCRVGLPRASDFDVGTNTTGNNSRRHSRSAAWRVILVVGLAIIFGLLPVLQRQLTLRQPPMVP